LTSTGSFEALRPQPLSSLCKPINFNKLENKGKIFIHMTPNELVRELLNYCDRKAKITLEGKALMIKRFAEERCGSVDYQKLGEANEVLESTGQSGHLLSCGGIHIPQEAPESPVNQGYQFITLQNKKQTIMTLRGLKTHRITQADSDPLWLLEGEEAAEQAPSTPSALSPAVKKLFREHLN
jgi:hypothetical protein